MRTATALLCLGACLAAGNCARTPPGSDDVESGSAQRTERQPDVLFLAIDDLKDWVGFLGGYAGEVHTPNLDRLAARGVRFTHAYTPAPVCNASRVALLTGQRPHESGVYHNNQDRKTKIPGAETLPEAFARAGYATRGAGKIFHHGFPEPETFEEWYEGPARYLPSEDRRPLNGLPGRRRFDWGPIDTPDTSFRDFHVAGWGADRLRESFGQPLFLAVGIFRPHLPWYVPSVDFEHYPLEDIRLPEEPDDDLDDLPESALALIRAGDHATVLAGGQWAAAVQAYLASITFADRCIGRVLDALDASGRADSTIIVLWSDHGWHLGEKRHWRKFTLWEEACRVPLVIVAPGLTRPGTVCDTPVDLMDIFPTLNELCDLPPGQGEIAGASLVPLLTNPDAQRARPALSTFGENNHSLRTARWRFTRYADGGTELYDHDSDPEEWTNLAGRPEHAELERELGQWFPVENAPNTAPPGSR